MQVSSSTKKGFHFYCFKDATLAQMYQEICQSDCNPRCIFVPTKDFEPLRLLPKLCMKINKVNVHFVEVMTEYETAKDMSEAVRNMDGVDFTVSVLRHKVWPDIKYVWEQTNETKTVEIEQSLSPDIDHLSRYETMQKIIQGYIDFVNSADYNPNILYEVPKCFSEKPFALHSIIGCGLVGVNVRMTAQYGGYGVTISVKT